MILYFDHAAGLRAPFGLYGLLAVVGFLAAREFYGLCSLKGIETASMVGALAAASMFMPWGGFLKLIYLPGLISSAGFIRLWMPTLLVVYVLIKLVVLKLIIRSVITIKVINTREVNLNEERVAELYIRLVIGVITRNKDTRVRQQQVAFKEYRIVCIYVTIVLEEIFKDIIRIDTTVSKVILAILTENEDVVVTGLIWLVNSDTPAVCSDLVNVCGWSG